MKLRTIRHYFVFFFLLFYIGIVMATFTGLRYGGYLPDQDFRDKLDDPAVVGGWRSAVADSWLSKIYKIEKDKENYREEEYRYYLRHRPTAEHIFGVDRKYRDIFVRFCTSTANGFKFSIIAVSTFLLAGIFIGIGISYFEGKFANLIKFLFNLIGSYPILLLLFLAAIYLQEYVSIMLLVLMGLFGLFRSHDLAELIRQRVSYLRKLNFFEACIALGLPRRVIIFKHILLKECLGIILVQSAIMMGQAILMETTLTYLDFGETESQGNVTWGSMLNQAKDLFDYGFSELEYMVPTLAIAIFPFMFIMLADILKEKYVVLSK